MPSCFRAYVHPGLFRPYWGLPGHRQWERGRERAGAGQWALTPGPSQMGLFSGQTVEVGPFPTVHTLKKSFR